MLRFVLSKEEFPLTVEFSSLVNGFEKHTHGQFEMVIITKGSGLHTVNDETEAIKAGDVFVINQHVSHAFDETMELEVCNIGFPEEVLDGAGPELRRLPGFHALFVTGPIKADAPFLCKLSLSSSQLSETVKLIQKLNSELKARKPAFEVISRAYFYELIVLLSRQYLHMNDSTIISIAKAASYMEENYPQKLTLEQLAEISGFSVRHFNRLFMKHYNKTPIQYLTDIRLEAAQDYLSNTGMKLIDIAIAVGFYDESVLSRQFKKKYGFTPLRFKKLR